MTRWSDASGFFLLETMGVAAVLISVVSASSMTRNIVFLICITVSLCGNYRSVVE